VRDPVLRRVFENLGILLGGRAAAGVLSIGYLVIAARVLGPERYGVMVLVHALAMAVGGIVAFPGWHGLVRYGVDALESGAHDRLARLLRFAGSIELLGGVLAIVAAAVLATLLGQRLGWDAEAQRWAIPYSLAVLASVRATPGGLLQIVRRFDLLAAHNLVTPAIRLVGSILAATLGWGLSGFLAVWLIAALAEGGTLWCGSGGRLRESTSAKQAAGTVSVRSRLKIPD
jgi:O-antigen/teichoic acid export membrane protein